jgi:hypothetical protein
MVPCGLGLNVDMVVVVSWAAHLKSAGKASWLWELLFWDDDEDDEFRRRRWALANCHSAGNTSADPVAVCLCRLALSATME